MTGMSSTCQARDADLEAVPDQGYGAQQRIPRDEAGDYTEGLYGAADKGVPERREPAERRVGIDEIGT